MAAVGRPMYPRPITVTSAMLDSRSLPVRPLRIPRHQVGRPCAGFRQVIRPVGRLRLSSFSNGYRNRYSREALERTLPFDILQAGIVSFPAHDSPWLTPPSFRPT